MARTAEPPADSKVTVPARRGRPRVYKDNAERQRAHRLRVKQQMTQLKALQATIAEGGSRPPQPQEKPRTGREMLEALRANGFVGAWANRDDIGDSVEFARQLRRRVWSREENG